MADNFFDAEAVKKAVEEAKTTAKTWSPAPGGRVLPPVTPPSRIEEAKEAMRMFEAVAAGRLAPRGSTPGSSYRKPRPSGPRPGSVSEPTRYVTPEQGLEAILTAINSAGDDDDILQAASAWITRITNSIYDTIREITEKEE